MYGEEKKKRLGIEKKIKEGKQKKAHMKSK